MIKDENINCTIEALILASPQPVSAKKLSEVVSELTPARVRQAIGDLNNVYLGCGSSFRVREIAGGYQFHILPDFEIPIKKMLSRQRTVRLTRAALETLAIIAYKQPAAKTAIEHIRGVSCDGVLHNLMERKLIAIAGRSDAPGRPLLYKTDSEFLKFFGLNRISDLPRMEEIEEMIRQADGPSDQTVLPLADQAGQPLTDGETEAGQIVETIATDASEKSDQYKDVDNELDATTEEAEPDAMAVSITPSDEPDQSLEYTDQSDDTADLEIKTETEVVEESPALDSIPDDPVPEEVDPDKSDPSRPVPEQLVAELSKVEEDQSAVNTASDELPDSDHSIANDGADLPEYRPENESITDSDLDIDSDSVSDPNLSGE